MNAQAFSKMPKGGGPAGAVASALVAVGVVGAIGYNSVFTGDTAFTRFIDSQLNDL
jgi:hypothetical protein